MMDFFCVSLDVTDDAAGADPHIYIYNVDIRARPHTSALKNSAAGLGRGLCVGHGGNVRAFGNIICIVFDFHHVSARISTCVF